MKKGAAHTAKIALKEFVACRCDKKIEGFNSTFGTRLKSFDELLTLQALPNATQEQRDLKKAFLRFTAERYFAVTSRAIREADPNHLVLGARFAGTGGADPAVWQVSGKYCDVVTFNCYPMAAARKGVAGAAKAFFVREGDAFRAGNGRIEMSGKLGDGNLVRRVTLDGAEKSFGQYNALVQTLDAGGQNRWTDAQKGLYFRLYSEFKGALETQVPNLWGMPAADGWLDKADGRFFGAVASKASDIQIYFWLDGPDGGAHPDARLEIAETAVAPGAVYTPAEPVFLLCVAGTGGSEAWLKAAQELKKVVE